MFLGCSPCGNGRHRPPAHACNSGLTVTMTMGASVRCVDLLYKTLHGEKRRRREEEKKDKLYGYIHAWCIAGLAASYTL